MSEITDQDLEDDVNNALDEDDQSQAGADNDQDDIAEDDGLDAGDDGAEGDEDQDQDPDDPGTDTSRSAPADDKDLEEDDDDDPAIDFARPDFGDGSTPEVKEFDIRTLPKDPETGLIDPVEANRLINEHYSKQGKASQEQQQRIEQTKDLLTKQWVRVSKKYPEVYKKPRLRELARDLHMNSIGTDKYLTPAQAAAKVDRTRRSLIKSGYKSAKTRQTVVKTTGTQRSSGRAGDGGQPSDYDKAKKLANSRDPKKAREGRKQMLRIRREARKSLA